MLLLAMLVSFCVSGKLITVKLLIFYCRFTILRPPHINNASAATDRIAVLVVASLRQSSPKTPDSSAVLGMARAIKVKSTDASVLDTETSGVNQYLNVASFEKSLKMSL